MLHYASNKRIKKNGFTFLFAKLFQCNCGRLNVASSGMPPWGVESLFKSANMERDGVLCRFSWKFRGKYLGLKNTCGVR